MGTICVLSSEQGDPEAQYFYFSYPVHCVSQDYVEARKWARGDPRRWAGLARPASAISPEPGY